MTSTRLKVDSTNHHLNQGIDKGAETVVSHMTKHVTPQIQTMNELPVIHSLKIENCIIAFLM